MTTTYHIQDLRLLLPPLDFELRVNKHYPEVNLSFREWLQELPRGDLVQAEDLSTHGFDLLCSLCFPTIDPPQLLRVSKLCALTFLANDGLVRAEVSPSRWLNSFPNPERLLRAAHSIRTTQTRELQRSPHVTSGTNVLQLASNLLSLFYPLREANTRNSHPGLPEFLVILENTHDHKFSEELTNDTLLETLWRCTTNIIMRSQDLASYSSSHPPECDQCTVCHSLKWRGFTLQAAVNEIRQSIESEVGKFVHVYKLSAGQTCDNGDAVAVAGAMRDCIAGFIHWVYEGERYFGKQYEEVAKFGWVFMGIGGGASADSDEVGAA